MKLQKLLVFILSFSIISGLMAQDNVGIGTNTPDASAALDITAIDKGVLIPRMTAAQRNVIASPATGLLVYQIDSDNGYYFFNGSEWSRLSDKPSELERVTEAGNTGWRILGRNSNNYGNIGIGAIDLSYSDSISITRGAIGENSFAVGQNTSTPGVLATAWGNNNEAEGDNSTAWGSMNQAQGDWSTAWGNGNVASGGGATVFGSSNAASEEFSTAWGLLNTASAWFSTAWGQGNQASGDYSTTLGQDNQASGEYSTAWGKNNEAEGDNATAWGSMNQAQGDRSTAWGNENVASGGGATVFGSSNAASEEFSTAWGLLNTASAWFSTAWGQGNQASGDYSTTLGQDNQASGEYSTAWGNNNEAEGDNSTAWGSMNQAQGDWSTAWGNGNVASGGGATVFGSSNAASEEFSTAWGLLNTASAWFSTAWGQGNQASGDYSTAWGLSTVANGDFSTSFGANIEANSAYETVIGRFNTLDIPMSPTDWNINDKLFVVGNGTSNSSRSNALTLYKNGTLSLFNHSTQPSNFQNKFYIQDNEPYFDGSGLKSQLEKISQGGNTGWRILGRDENNYGDIGNQAIDFSFSNVPNNFLGATGDLSVAMGIYTEASGSNSLAHGIQTKAIGLESVSFGYQTVARGWDAVALGDNTVARSFASLALGRFNDTISSSSTNTWIPTDPILTVGNGNSPSNRSNALTLYKNGTLSLFNHNTQPSNFQNNFYIQNNEPYFNGSGLKSQLEKISQGGNTGWRLSGSIPSHYGNIGERAIDLSFSNSNSTIRGATGNNSVALGQFTRASGTVSIAMGENTHAEGYSSTAMGFQTLARGFDAVSMGQYTLARSFASLAIGRYNDTIAASSIDSWIPSDPILTVGNGTSNVNRSNALTILKNGRLGISNANNPSFSLSILNNNTGIDALSDRMTLYINGVSGVTVRESQRVGVAGSFSPQYSLSIGENGSGINRPSTNILTFHSNFTERMRITSSGVGIGTNAPSTSSKLTIGGGNWDFATTDGDLMIGNSTHKLRFGIATAGGGAGTSRIRSSDGLILGAGTHDIIMTLTTNNRVMIGSGTPDQSLSVNGNASKSGGGSWATFSDIRTKRDVKAFVDGLDLVLNLKPITFKYNEKSGYSDLEKEYIGFSAQEVEKIAPYMVDYIDDSDKSGLADKRIFDESALSKIFVNAIQEQQNMIDELKKENELLRAQMDSVSQLISEIKEMKNNLASSNLEK